MTFVSYAQNFEDVILWRALSDVTKGHYLDIGAHDPVIDSVSLAFYEAGWRGTHVEPIPAYAAKLRQARLDETVVQAAVTDAEGPIDFYEIVETGLSTGKSNIADHHVHRGFEQRKLCVPCVRLDRLLDSGPETVHWAKIDVEGMESEVLRSWGDSPARPWILIVESTFPMSQTPTHQEWLSHVADRGYVEAFYDGLSRYFVHESQAQRKAAFEAPANIFDDFVVTPGHFSARANREELENAKKKIEDGEISEAELSAQLTFERARAADLEDQLGATEQSLSGACDKATAAAGELARAQADQAAMAKDLAHATREYAAALDTLSREREAAESDLRRQLEDSRATAATTQTELVKSNERATSLQDALTRVEQDREQRLNRYRAALTQSRSAIARADALIRGAQRPSPRWRLLGQFLGLSRPPLALRALANWSPPLIDDQIPVSETQLSNQERTTATMQNATTAGTRNPYLRANSLAELLEWNDVDFVRCAYVTMLGRQPDPEGEAYYVRRIRSGRSKLEVLWQLRRSSEGRRHDPGIAGLDRMLKRARRERTPFVGAITRGITRRPAEPSKREMLRAILHGNAVIEGRMGDIAVRLEAIEASVPTVPQRLPTQMYAASAQPGTHARARHECRVPAIVRVSERIRSEWLRA